VVENGTFNPTTGAYEMHIYNELYTLSYQPAIGDRPASTVLTMIYLMPTGEFYSVSLTLDPTEYGNLFEGTYALYNGSGFDVQSSGWGYVDANSFTDVTPLTCYVFDGMNDYEDALLLDYAALMANMLETLNDFMPNVESGLSIKDLGFLFYFG
jgi:hypothetical protein